MLASIVGRTGRTAFVERKRSFKDIFKRSFSSTLVANKGDIADHCDLNIVSSPYPPIPPGPYPLLAEYVMQNWKGCGGHLEDELAILDGTTGLKRTFHDYYTRTGGIAASFKYDLDVAESSTVAIFAPNHVDYLPVTLATTLCGAKLAPINPLSKVNELQVILDRSHSSVLVAHFATMDVALEAAKGSKTVKHIVIITDSGEALPEGVITLDSIKDHDKAFYKTVHDHHGDTASHPCLLPYSSCTTGLPKGVCLTHENLVTNLMQCDEIEGMAFPAGHKLITPLPFFHIYAMTVSMLYCAWKGNTVITTSGRFDLEQFCDLVQTHQAQRSHLVPPILIGLAKHPLVDKYDLSCLQTIISAAAPLGVDTELAVKERLNCRVKQAWGMSELSPIGTLNSDFAIKSASVGPLAPSTYGKIIDDQGKSLGPNESGELAIKGPQVMMGYLDDHEKTAECLSSGGWLRTGDVAHYDEEGYFFITDRIKELIKVKGFQVAPAEIEALLLTNELVNDAAVIQIEDDDAGELPRAYIVLKDQDPSDKEGVKEEIYEWVKERVAPYKRLDGGIVLTDAIPKSASGKILRRILRDELSAELSN